MPLTNAPLLGTRRDQALFVNREEERSALLHNVKMGWNTLVLGPAGVGKTSLLNRFAADLEEALTSDARDSDDRLRPIPIQVTGRPENAPWPTGWRGRSRRCRRN